MPDNAATRLARIKAFYERRHEDKLVMQKDMVVLIDEYDYTYQSISDETGVPLATVGRWVKAYRDSISQLRNQPRLTPQEMQDRSEYTIAKRVLAEAELEHVEQLLSELPKERQEKIAAAVGDPYFQAERTEIERRSQQTDVERAQEERDKAALKQPVIDFTAELSAESVGLSLTTAGETVQGMAAEGLLTTKAMRLIEVYNEQWLKTLDFAREISGEDEPI